METLSLQNTVIAVSSLVTLSVISGVMCAVLVQEKRDRANYWFALFCLSLLLWSLVALIGPIRALRFGLADDIRAYLLATSIGASAISFYEFIVQFVRIEVVLVRRLATAAPFVLGGGLVIIWSGLAFADPLPEMMVTRLTLLGYVAVGAMVIYAVIALFLIWNSTDERAPRLRIPALLLVASYITLIWGELAAQTPIAILLATAAAALLGWAVLRFQWFDPLREISDELRVVTRDLRQAVTDLAIERNRTESLTQQLAVAGQYKSDFLDNLGHKLRTPLNSIAGYSELLVSAVYGDLNEKQLDRIEKIHRNGSDLLNLINDMLDLNRLDAGRLSLNWNPFSLPNIMERVLADVEKRKAEKDLQIRVDLPPDLMQVYGDPTRICQVLTHLVDNALKFTFSGEVQVKAANVRVQKGVSVDFKLPVIGWLGDGEWILIQVVDSGIGIPPEEQAKIFDEFYQVNDQRTVEGGGTGLGLAIARKMVELHKGTIWVKSIPDQGSTFFVALRAYGSSINGG